MNRMIAMSALAAGLLLLGAGPMLRAGSVRGPESRAADGGEETAAPDFGLGLSGVVSPNGIRLTAVETQKPAAQVGIEPGDVILAVNRHPVRSLRDWIDVLSD